MGSIANAGAAGITLPVIDISSRTDPQTAKELLDAAIKYGFLYVAPNGTPFAEPLVDSVFGTSQEFFTTASLSEKESCAITVTNRGWFGVHNENLDPSNHKRGDFKEGFNLGEFPDDSLDSHPNQRIPKVFKQNLDTLRKFEHACRDTVRVILDLLGLALELEEPEDLHYFSKRHPRKSDSTLRLLHYPAVQSTEYDDEVDIRAGAHSDYGSLTLLFQRPGQPGLEIQPPKSTGEDGQTETWTPVPVFPPGYTGSTTMPPILVNIGDLFSYWTNGLLRSTVHRVIFPKDGPAEDRYSIAYFAHPGDDVELTPIPSALVRDRGAVGLDGTPIKHGTGGGMEGERSLTAKEHLFKRLAATYTQRAEKAE